MNPGARHHNFTLVADSAVDDLGRRLVRLLFQTLRGRGVAVRTWWADGPGKALGLAALALGQVGGVVVACGGDDTAGGVVRALAGTGRVMGLVPCGRTNGFARKLGLTEDLGGIVATLLNGRIGLVDLGRAGGVYFCTAATLGLERAESGRPGSSRRLEAASRLIRLGRAFRVLGVLRPMEVELNWDQGSYSGRISVLAAANTEAPFGGLDLTPGADPDDGLLDVRLLEPRNRFIMAGRLAWPTSNGSSPASGAPFFRTKSLTIETEEPARVWADGRPLGWTPLTVEAAPRALAVLLPPETGREAV